MTAILNASTSSGVVITSDNSGNIVIQSNGSNVITTAGNSAVFSGSVSAPNTFSFKNRIINGGMSIWQRGTTYALTSTVAYGSADRFAFYQSGTANGVANQVSSGLAGFQYALKIGRNNGATTTGLIATYQVIETANCYDLAGQFITFSFYAKAGANFSASSSNITAYVGTGTGTDQNLANFAAGTWTGQTYPIASTQSITSSWVKYSFTATAASNASQFGIIIAYTPSGTAGADDNLYITGLQLELGSQATSFDYRDYGRELIMCQRYYQIPVSGSQQLISLMVRPDGYRQIFYPFKTTMRTAPTSSFTWNNDTSGVNAGTPTITPDYWYVWSASAIATSNLNPYITALSLSAEL